MKKRKIYTYLGTNGTIISPVHLEGIYCIEKYELTAADGKKLINTDGEITEMITIPADELNNWSEIDA